MTPKESREIFIESVLTESNVTHLKERGLYQKYVDGKVSVDCIYAEIKEQGV